MDLEERLYAKQSELWTSDLGQHLSYCKDLAFQCSSGCLHYTSMGLFATVCKYLSLDLQRCQDLQDLTCVILCDVDHDVASLFCKLLALGVVHSDSNSTVDMLREVIEQLQLSIDAHFSDEEYMDMNGDFSDERGLNLCKLEAEEENDKNDEDDDDEIMEIEPEEEILLPQSIELNDPIVREILHGGLTRHKTADSKRSNLIICNYCGEITDGLFNAQVHLAQHVGQKALECQICKKLLDKPSVFHSHIYGTHRVFSCEICGKQLGDNNMLQNHVKVKHEMKDVPNKCEICAKAFKAASSLITHMKKHSKERKFSCEYCAKAFKKAADLESHISKMHNRNKQKYGCTTCGKGYKTEFELKQHQRHHSNEKPFGCSKCKKKFKYKYQAEKHETSHSKVMLSQCKECNKVFRNREAFYIHAADHAGIFPFTCLECNKGLANKTAAKKHTIHDHPNVKNVQTRLNMDKDLLDKYHTYTFTEPKI